MIWERELEAFIPGNERELDFPLTSGPQPYRSLQYLFCKLYVTIAYQHHYYRHHESNITIITHCHFLPTFE